MDVALNSFSLLSRCGGVVVLEVAMHMRHAKKIKKEAAHYSLSLTSLLSEESNVVFLLYSLVLRGHVSLRGTSVNHVYTSHEG